MTTWLLDTNVLIQAFRRDYGMDFCPGFWDWLDLASRNGKVYSLEKVAQELRSGDGLADWAVQRPHLFLPLAPEDTPALTDLATWAQSGPHSPAATQEFLQVADFYLVAVARARGMTLVTHEVFAAAAKRIKIPNACIAMNVPFARPEHMLRHEGVRLVLEPRLVEPPL